MNRVSQKISAAAGALMMSALLFGTSAAGAADQTGTGSDITVKISQDAIDSPAQAEAVYGKLRAAAGSVCGMGVAGFQTMEVRNRNRKCYEKVLADAVAKINQPLLTALHESRGKANKNG
jgi:UrcA family protein